MRVRVKKGQAIGGFDPSAAAEAVSSWVWDDLCSSRVTTWLSGT